MSYFYYDGPNTPMEPTVHKVFPTCLFEFPCFVDEQNDIIRDLNSRWATREIEKAFDQESYQTEDTLDKEPIYHNFCIKVITAVQSAWSEYGYTSIKPYITSMWANSLGKNASIQSHCHSNSFFSGVWYPEDVEIDYATNGGAIKFIDPVKRYTIMPQVRGLNDINMGEIIIRPKKGLLLLFPSWLEHGTIPNRYGTEPRFSVSFNIWMRGDLGYNYALNRLNCS